MTRIRLGLSHLRQHNLITISETVLIIFAVVLWISDERLTFFSTLPYLMIKESLSLAF